MIKNIVSEPGQSSASMNMATSMCDQKPHHDTNKVACMKRLTIIMSRLSHKHNEMTTTSPVTFKIWHMHSLRAKNGGSLTKFIVTL